MFNVKRNRLRQLMCLQCLHNGEDILVIGFQRGDVFYPKSDQVWIQEAISFLRMAVN